MGAGQTISPRACIGIARIDYQCANPSPCCQMLPAHLHGRSAVTVLREHASHAGSFIEQENR